VVVLTDPFQGMGACRNSTETNELSGHAPRSGPEVKNGSTTKNGAPERLGCGTIHVKVSQILQRVSTDAVWQMIGGDRMVELLGVVVSPFWPTSRIEGGDRTTTLRRRDVGAVSASALVVSLGKSLNEIASTFEWLDW